MPPRFRAWVRGCRPAGGGRGVRASVGDLLLALLLLAHGVARAQGVSVSVENVPGVCRARGVFIVPVPTNVAWQVLTDYAGISRFVKSVRASRIERSADGRKFVRQDAEANVFMVRRRMQVLMEIEEDPLRRIRFRDVLHDDFKSYAGEWRLSRVPGATRVDYELAAVPSSGLARTLCRGVLRSSARDLLRQVRAEMLRRAARSR